MRLGRTSDSAQEPTGLRIRTLYKVFGPYLKPYRGRIVLAYLALGLSVAMTVLRPWPLKLILDSLLLNKRKLAETVPPLPASIDALDPHLLLTLLCASLVVIVLLESTFGFVQKVLFSGVGQSATTDVLEQVYTHLQTLPRPTHEGARTGDLIVRLTSDIKTMRELLVTHVQKLGNYALTFGATIAVMAAMNWQLTLLGLAVVPVIYYVSFRFSAEIRSATRQKRTREGAVASIVQETLSSIAVVQAFAQEEQERTRFREEARQSLSAGLESARLGGAFSRSIKVLSTVGTALVIWFGARQVLADSLTPGDLVVFAAYLAELYTPIQQISELSVQFMESLVSGERVLDLVQTVPKVKDSPNAVKAPPFRGEIVFEDVVAGYQREAPVLRGINFTVEPGETVALVGASGSGKSTILNLLLRFIDPWEGRVLIDGDVRRFTLGSLRHQVSVVLQESILFRRTVHENIAYGRPRAHLHEVVEAARHARAHEFIRQLPEGYDTMLDERGGNLSGGQKQRIALARAFLRDTPLLVLDEPTSGLDAVTEAQLMDTVKELARGRTTVLIAHRLSTVEHADRILVLDRGQIAEQGTHVQLMSRAGLYRKLYEAQARQDTGQNAEGATRETVGPRAGPAS